MIDSRPASGKSVDATLLVAAEQATPLMVPLSHGNAAVISIPHPTRDSPNQDAAAIIPAGDDRSLLAVADGMGGTLHGGEAAATVIRQLSTSLRSPADSPQLRSAILDGIEQANRIILADYAGSGSTLAAVEINAHTVRPYHAGDSEILVVGQQGKIKLLTISHSPVGLGVEAGLLDPDEALHHRDRHLVLNAVGTSEMRIELGAPLELDRHDTLLLASDGLTDNLVLDEIIGIIRKGPLDQSLAKLASLASQRMTESGNGHPSKPDDLTLLAYRRTR